MVKGAGIRGRMAGSERERGEGATKMKQPGFQNRRRDEVDFVEDKDKPFGAGICGSDLMFDFSRACAVRVASVKDVKNYVGGRENAFECFVICASG